MRDPDEPLERSTDDPGIDDRGTKDRYGSRVAQAGPKKKAKQSKPKPPEVTVTPEDRSQRPPPKLERDMNLGWKVPEPPSITERDLLRARVVNYPVVRVDVIDLSGVLSRYWKTVGPAIEKALKGLNKQVADVLRDFRWPEHSAIATYRRSEATAKEKAAQLPLDFPCYFLPTAQNRPSDDTSALQMMRRIMTEHGVRAKEQKLALAEWKKRTLRGVTGAPGNGFKKAVFHDSEQLKDEAEDDAHFFANHILHELGHAFGITGKNAHPYDGSLMQTGKKASIGPAAYNDAHAKAIVIRINAWWNLELKQLARP